MLIRKITFHIILAALLLFAGAASAANWIESADIGWYEANSANVTFTINTAEELAGLARLVNDGTEQFEGKTVKLASDIDLSGGTWTAIGNDKRTDGWQLLNCFNGKFDGCAHTVSGLGEINSAYTSQIYDYDENVFRSKMDIGLFGFLNTTGDDELSIKNLNIRGDIRPALAAKKAGVDTFFVGALVGSTEFTSMLLPKKTIESCSFVGSIVTDCNGHVGGLSSENWCEFRSCYVSADIVVSGDKIDKTAAIGGVVAKAEHGVENCGFTGSITVYSPNASSGYYGNSQYRIGGVSGMSSGINSAARCNIEVNTGSNEVIIGGVVGLQYGALIACTGECMIKASAEAGHTFAVGGLAGGGGRKIEYCSSACSISAVGAMRGALVGIMNDVGNLEGCEWLAGNAAPQKAIGNKDDDITDEQALKVTEAKNLHAATAILMPIYEITENIPETVEALIYPTNYGDGVSLDILWGTSNKKALEVAPTPDAKAVMLGKKTGVNELYLNVSGFPGGNSWSAKALVKSTLTPLSRLKLSAEEITLEGAGASEEVTASITPGNGASYPELKWSYEVVSGDAASAEDLEINYIETSRHVKITAKNFVEGARYRLTAAAADGTGLSASLTVKAETPKPEEPEKGGGSGGCSTAGSGSIALLPAVFMAVRVRRGCRK